MTDLKDDNNKILALMREALRQDQELREKYQIGDKFRFIRDRLVALQTNIETKLASMAEEEKKVDRKLQADETLVYVHLFNAQGIVLKSWQKMLNPAVFYEYSINRPIYDNSADIESFIRSKPNKNQHGYLIVSVKKDDILPGEKLHDSLGGELVKVKENALKMDNLFGFVHNGIEYELNEQHELTKKEETTGH